MPLVMMMVNITTAPMIRPKAGFPGWKIPREGGAVGVLENWVADVAAASPPHKTRRMQNTRAKINHGDSFSLFKFYSFMGMSVAGFFYYAIMILLIRDDFIANHYPR